MIAAAPDEAPALIDGDADRVVTYGALRQLISRAQASIAAESQGRRRLVFLHPVGVDGIVAMLACLEARLPVALVDLSMPTAGRIIESWRPSLMLGPSVSDGTPFEALPALMIRRDYVASDHALHEALALLLTTSGSTGDPKLVRLSLHNLSANAAAIAAYLQIGPDDRGLQSLPLFHAYGLSLLTSHLSAGASFVVTGHSFLRPEFWQVVARQRATSFAGVPYSYETLLRLRLDPARHPSVRTWTQAGGALRPELIARFHEKVAAVGGRFFVMYGQTEATARMSYLPPDVLPAKAGAIGQAIPGGQLSLEAVEGDETSREIVYRGPNVMLGYAIRPEDLAQGDTQGGVLRTGDLGRVDAQGLFWVTGRRSRIAKLFGHRVSLDDLEREAERLLGLPCAAVERDGAVELVIEASELPVDAALTVARLIGVPPAAVRARAIASLPRTMAGKKHYAALLKDPGV